MKGLGSWNLGNDIKRKVNDMGISKKNSMAIASVVMSACAVTMSSNIMSAMFFGGLGITFAQLSKTEEKMSTLARIGLGVSIVAIIASLMMMVAFGLSLARSGMLDYYMTVLEDFLF